MAFYFFIDVLIMRDILMILFSIVACIAVIVLSIWVIKSIINSAENNPTWQGIIFSAMMGLLLLYLFFCWMGWMGEERSNE